MRIVFFGTPEFAVTTLEKLLHESPHEVIAVVTQPDKKRGRGNKMIPSPVKELALKHHLPVWQPTRIKKDKETLESLHKSPADVFVVVAYGQILSKKILNMPKLGCINVHGSILPEYRGAAPIQWSIYDGKTETGVTTMLMDEGMDTGGMLLKAHTPIDLFSNVEDLSLNLASQGADLLLETLIKLEKNDIKPILQDESSATYARLIDKADYHINWNKSALQIHNQIRAFYPHCITIFRDQILKITQSLPLIEINSLNLPPNLMKLPALLKDINTVSGEIGEIVKTIKNFGFIVQTGSDLLLILEVQLAGKKQQSAWNFINGTHLQLGEKLSVC
ncbi:methionyl-tRNA formyltransferase [Geminocystis sp. NIES-3708]|uniref:methionyl-tRNA formyltransferase n=1 Tax=Geminocystis sp. NIES-3708 TaxID=1615909 RepID=UPI0005FCA88F|nr:methionyl-tRNA formyltransferase [Geminocystis sp. NIES-3708]BAQ62078.1 methionyl-tRNA formyltransferase [Geminocystis sp. NIES-3708]